jgi:hypothetical protein
VTDEKISVQVEVPQAWGIQEAGTGTALIFKVAAGNVGYYLDNRQLSQLAERILTLAGKAAQATTPDLAETLDTDPVPVAAMAINKHPQDPSSALLALHTGNLDLVFEIDLAMLHGHCDRFLRSVEATGKPRRNN